MNTHDLREVKNLPLNVKVFEGRFRPGSTYIQSWTRPDPKPFNPTLDDVFDMTLVRYVETIKFHRPKINFEMKCIYGKPIYFEDKKLSYMIWTIKDLMAISGKTVRNAIRELRGFLGYPCYFYRYKGTKLVPVDPDKIVLAYKLMKEGKNIIQIEDVLFF